MNNLILLFSHLTFFPNEDNCYGFNNFIENGGYSLRFNESIGFIKDKSLFLNPPNQGHLLEFFSSKKLFSIEKIIYNIRCEGESKFCILVNDNFLFNSSNILPNSNYWSNLINSNIKLFKEINSKIDILTDIKIGISKNFLLTEVEGIIDLEFFEKVLPIKFLFSINKFRVYYMKSFPLEKSFFLITINKNIEKINSHNSNFLNTCGISCISFLSNNIELIHKEIDILLSKNSNLLFYKNFEYKINAKNIKFILCKLISGHIFEFYEIKK